MISRPRRAIPRDDHGRFSGIRVDVESVPRLPTFPVRWLLADPRGRPYFVFWTTDKGKLVRAMKDLGERRLAVVRQHVSLQPTDAVGCTL